MPIGRYAGWDAFGLAVQAYQKRAPAVIDWLAQTGAALGRRIPVRLVKGAYWDTEVKRAQERGLADYPVFTRKAMTDLCYFVCARKLLALRNQLYPQFATHNALTVASIMRTREAWKDTNSSACTAWARSSTSSCALIIPPPPFGSTHRSGAIVISSLISCGASSKTARIRPSYRSRLIVLSPVASLLERPQNRIGEAPRARHPKIPLPRDLYAPLRRNSAGVEFGDRASLALLLRKVREAEMPDEAARLALDGEIRRGNRRPVHSPIDGTLVGHVSEGDEAIASTAMLAGQRGFAAWSAVPNGATPQNSNSQATSSKAAAAS